LFASDDQILDVVPTQDPVPIPILDRSDDEADIDRAFTHRRIQSMNEK
jgi:hypothetical protein